MSKAGEALVARWSQAAADLGARSDDAPFLRALRERARMAFIEQGLPHTRLEAWRHTSLSALEDIEWSVTGGASPAPDRLPELSLAAEEAGRVVLVDGRMVPSLSSAEVVGSRITSMAGARNGTSALGDALGRLADPKLDAFTALNTALLDDGVSIEIDRHRSLDRPLHVVIAGATARRLNLPRLAIAARTGSRGVVVVEHVTLGDGPHLTDLVTELIVEDDAQLELVFLQRESDQSFLISNTQVRQGRDARLAIHTISIGGRLTRNTLGSVLSDPGAEVDMRGLFIGSGGIGSGGIGSGGIGSGGRHVDNHTVADHAMPHTTSRELYKGILGGASRGVFCGRVIVRPDAQKTDSTQSNPNLLLTPQAEIDTQPQLEIYADDVKCSHGSTIGRLDEDALFYLRSRGIGQSEARLLLTRGFANEIVEALPGQGFRERVAAWIDAALEAAIPDGTGGG